MPQPRAARSRVSARDRGGGGGGAGRPAQISTATVVPLPSASPTPPHAQHGAALQEMEMLAASVQDRWWLGRASAGFSAHPDRFPRVVSLHLGWP